MHINRLTALLLSGFSVLLSSVTQAQITEPNAEGVSMGHLHYEVASPETERTFWLNLGAQDLGLEGRIGVSFPGLIILLSEGETAGGSEGSVVNHVAFRVESLKEIEDKGFELEYNQEFPGIASIYSPSGERIELFDDNLATNIGQAKTLPLRRDWPPQTQSGSPTKCHKELQPTSKPIPLEAKASPKPHTAG